MPKWDDYSIRSTAYYQKKGGVYSQLLTILMNMKSTFQYRNLRPAYVILNRASYFCDCYISTGVFDEETFGVHLYLDQYVILILILATYPKVDRQMIVDKYLSLDKKYFRHFESLWEQVVNGRTNAVVSECAESNTQDGEGLDNPDKDEIVALKAKLKDAEDSIEKLRKTIQNLNAKVSKPEDRYFALEILMEYVRSRRHYHNAQQIINMIKDLLRGCNEKEVWDKVDALEQEMLEKDPSTSVINNNNISGSNVLTGLVSNPNFPIGVDPIEFIKSAVDKELNRLNHES